MIDPEVSPLAWDAATIGTEQTPGLCEIVDGGGRPFKWDVQKAYGSDGPATALTGAAEQRFTMRLRFFDGVGGLSSVEQRELYFSKIVPLLEKTTNGKQAVDFYHPSVSDPPIGIRSVVCEEFGRLTEETDGVWAVAVKLLKYSKPKPKVGKPKSSAKGKKSGDAPPVKDALDKQIEALTKQFKELA